MEQTPMSVCMRCCLLFALWAVTLPQPVSADVVNLKNGGLVRGELLPVSDSSVSADQVGIRTLTGAIVVVPKTEVRTTQRRRLVTEQYERMNAKVQDSVGAHWELAEWCRTHTLSRERELHLLKIIDLDPQNEAAHKALGHIHQDGVWTTRDELMASRGFVKHKGRYLLPQEVSMLQQEEAESEAEKSWYKRVKLWRSWCLSDRSDRQQEGYSQLKTINDPHAIAALTKSLHDDEKEGLRELLVEILSRMKDERAVVPLVQQSLNDPSYRVRLAAINALVGRDVKRALPLYHKALRHELNPVVNRAAEALGAIADPASVPSLIDALVTTHYYRMYVPEQQMSVGVTTDGNFAPGGVALPPEIALLLATGQLPYGVQVNQVNPPSLPPKQREIVVKRDDQNGAVLSALRKMTGENFGYDESAWRVWLGTHKAIVNQPRMTSEKGSE